MKPTPSLAVVLATIFALTAAPSAFAQSTSTLGLLVTDNGSLTIGDKTFSNFGYVDSQIGANPANLTVTASIVNGIYYLDWAGIIVVNNLSGTSSLLGDLQLRYTVTSNPGSIVMIDQNYTPNATPSPGDQIIIGETVKNNQGVIVGNSTLTLNPIDLSDPTPEPGDNLVLTGGPYQQLSVVKDILIAAAPGQLVGLSDVEQSFHQVVVPEPSTIALLALAGCALFCGRRKLAS